MEHRTMHQSTNKPERLLHTQKELAAELDRSRSYVADMEAGGFRLPATRSEAIEWIRQNPRPGKFRKKCKAKESATVPEGQGVDTNCTN